MLKHDARGGYRGSIPCPGGTRSQRLPTRRGARHFRGKAVNLYERQDDQKHLYGELRDNRHVNPLDANVRLGEHFGLFPSRPAPMTQNNFQMNVYLRSREELQYFIENGEWPTDSQTNPGPSRPGSDIFRSGHPEKEG